MRPENRQACAHLRDQILTTDPDFVIKRHSRARRSRVRSTASQLVTTRAPQRSVLHSWFVHGWCFAAWVHSNQSGRLAQLGERRVRNAEVGSSILLPSTNFS